MTAITQLNGGVALAVASLADGDKIPVTDVSDTTEDANGTTKPYDIGAAMAAKADYFTPATETGTSFTLTNASHAGRSVYCTNAGAVTVTWDTGHGMAIGATGTIFQNAAGIVSIVAGTGTLEVAGEAAVSSSGVSTSGIRSSFDWELVEANTLRITRRAPVGKWGGIEAMANSQFGLLAATGLGASSAPGGFGCSVFNVQDSCALNNGSATTDAGGYIVRQRYRAAASAVNRVAGIVLPMAFRLDVGGKLNSGFPILIEGCVADSNANGSFFMGITNSITLGSTLTTVEPTAFTGDILGFGWDSPAGANTANGYLFYNDNAGGQTVVDLGAGFPKTQGYVYRIIIDKNAAGTALYAKVTNKITEVDSADYTLTSNLPRATVALYPALCRSSMATSFQADIDFSRISRGKVLE